MIYFVGYEQFPWTDEGLQAAESYAISVAKETMCDVIVWSINYDKDRWMVRSIASFVQGGQVVLEDAPLESTDRR